jgi:hypothetical protein
MALTDHHSMLSPEFPPEFPRREEETFGIMKIMNLLADNKRLVLSIALNVLLIAALSMLLYLIWPQLIYELDSVDNLWGRYSVRTYRTHKGDSAYFEVLMGHRRVCSHSGEVAFHVEVLGNDLTGNGMPNLAIRQWYGSAHGDSKYLIFELDGSVVREIDAIDGMTGVEFKDVNTDGKLEILGIDDSYGYLFGDSYANSPRPEVVLSFDKTQAKFVPDKKSMLKAPLSRDQFNNLRLKYKNDTEWSRKSRPPAELLATMFDLIYSGNEKQAWELFDAAGPEGSAIPAQKWREDVESALSRSPSYPVIANWNKSK